MCNDSHVSLDGNDVFPPLPEPVYSVDANAVTSEFADGLPQLDPVIGPPIQFVFKSLKAGCYLANYKPLNNPLKAFDGTIRVEGHTNGKTASGDLYNRPVRIIPPSSQEPRAA